jgi:hypothetical protein
VIQFWRAYLRLLESIPGVTSIDSHLFEFHRLGHRRSPGKRAKHLASTSTPSGYPTSAPHSSPRNHLEEPIVFA